MTYEHANEILSTLAFQSDDQEVREACIIAMTSISKEIPIRPEPHGNPNGMRGLTWWHVCTRCKGQVVPGELRCRKCGQVIQWNDA